MLSGLVMALSVAMSPGQCATCGPGGMEFQPGMASGSWVAGAGGGYNPYDSVASGGGGGGDQLYPLDSPEPWLHGYFQDMPAYSGYSSFRPHNYKHVLAQMQTASRWGIPATMPISHQWYHQYRQRAGMHPSWDTNLTSNGGGAGYQNYVAAPVPQQQVVQTSAQPQSRRPQYSQALDQAAALERGYPGTPIPGISTPNYQRSAATYRSMPTFSQQYSERFETLKDQLEQQSFHLQVMQQQLQQQQSARNTYRQAHDQFNGQAWAQPNHTQFNDPSQSSRLQAPGVFVAPQSAMPAQPAVMNPPQGLGQSMSPYSSQQNPGQQFSNGYSAQGMQQTAPQGFNPQMAPGNSNYPSQPMMIPQNPGFVMPQGFPQQGHPQQGYPQQGYPQQGYSQQGYSQRGYSQNWSNEVTPAGQGYSEAFQYDGPANYGFGPQASLPYGTNMAPSQFQQSQMAPRSMYSAQSIPTSMAGQYPPQYGQ